MVRKKKKVTKQLSRYKLKEYPDAGLLSARQWLLLEVVELIDGVPVGESLRLANEGPGLIASTPSPYVSAYLYNWKRAFDVRIKPLSMQSATDKLWTTPTKRVTKDDLVALKEALSEAEMAQNSCTHNQHGDSISAADSTIRGVLEPIVCAVHFPLNDSKER
jgi:hypothetical protein